MSATDAATDAVPTAAAASYSNSRPFGGVIPTEARTERPMFT